MDLATLISTRRTVHNFKAEKVEDGVVEEALRLALWAPNHKLTFPYVFISVGLEAREKLAKLHVELKQAKDGKVLSDVMAGAAKKPVLNPSHLIILGNKKGDEKRLHEDYASLACAVQIATLYLWENGIATKWSTGGFATHAKTYEILGLSPAEVQLEGCLMIGVADIVPPAPERPPLDHFLRRVK